MDARKLPRLIAAFGLTLALWTFPDGARAQAIFRGPYLTDVSPDGVTVLWETPTPSTGLVRFGLMSPSENSVASSTPSTHHAVRLSGLSAIAPPGSDFTYVVESEGRSHPGRFFTAVSGDTPFSFIVYGDNRTSREQHARVVEALMHEQRTVSFAVNTGDLVATGSEESHWDEFFDVESPFLSTMPLYVAIGNHEVRGKNWDVPRRLFDVPRTLPPTSNGEAFYHVVYGNTELIILNAEVDSLYTLDLLAGAQEAWLEQVLASPPPGVRHRFVFIHKGPYSSKRGRAGNFWLRRWLERFENAGVRIVFSGHDHYAERGFTENGLYYVIHGGGGAPLYDTLGVRVVDDHTIAFGETRLGYVVVDVDGPKVSVRIKGLEGEVVDSFSYGNTAAPECVTDLDCGEPPAHACPGGSWSCVEHACAWACGASDRMLSCLTNRTCEQRLGASCDGTPRCERPNLNPLSFYCTCDAAPDCAEDNDCAGRPAPMPCPGTWACVDEACEFTAEATCVAPDAGPAPADAGVRAPDGKLDAGGAASTPDAATAEGGDRAQVPASAGGAESASEGASTAGSETARGCSALPGGPFELAPVLALGMVRALRRRLRERPYLRR